MPRIEEVLFYIQGLWMMITNPAEGLKRMDFSPRGFVRSFWAMAYCLPPIVLGWVAYQTDYLSRAPEGSQVSGDFFFKLAVVDAVSWVLPLAAIGAVMAVSGHRPRLFGVLVAFNWLTVPSSWILSIYSLLVIFMQGDLAGYFIVNIGIPIIIFDFLVLNALLGGQKLLVLALLLTNVVATMYVSWIMQLYFGLA